MKFAIVNKALQVTAETPPEVIELGMRRCFIELHIDAISAGSLSVTFPASASDNGEWFPASATLGAEWVQPYLQKLQRLTGYAGEVPKIAAPRYGSTAFKNLCHTHIVTDAKVSSDGFEFAGFMRSQDWNGETAAQRYQALFSGYCRGGVGDTKHEPEFIELTSGLLKRNPNYLKMHAPHPAATSAEVFGVLFMWWLDNKATPGQRDVIERCMKNHHTVCPNDSLGAYFIRIDQGYRTAWDGPDSFVTFEQFKELQ